MLPVAAEHCDGYRTRMKTSTTDVASLDPVACLHAWLTVHAGAEPDVDHLPAALTTRIRWLDKPHEPDAVRVLAVCCAVVELTSAEEWAAKERSVRELIQFANEVRALLDKNRDVAKRAAARQDGYKAISKMDGPGKAAKAFAFGPLDVFERLESCGRDLHQYAVDAIEISHCEPRRGRPEQTGLAAASKHLQVAGFTYSEIAKLLPDGIPSSTPEQAEQAEERVRDRVREDRRTIMN